MLSVASETVGQAPLVSPNEGRRASTRSEWQEQAGGEGEPKTVTDRDPVESKSSHFLLGRHTFGNWSFKAF